MKISKSKRELALLLIEAGVTQFPEGANWAAQDSCGSVYLYERQPAFKSGSVVFDHVGGRFERVSNSKKIPNWHQAVLSRDEFDKVVAETVVQAEPQYCEPVTRSIPEPTATPTLDQLLQDWRNADDYAQRKQTEADEAAALRDVQWRAVQARAGEMGVTVGRREPVVTEPERDWEVNDRCVVVDSPDDSDWKGRECTLIRIDSRDKRLPYYVQKEGGDTYWVHSIRRP